MEPLVLKLSWELSAPVLATAESGGFNIFSILLSLIALCFAVILCKYLLFEYRMLKDNRMLSPVYKTWRCRYGIRPDIEKGSGYV